MCARFRRGRVNGSLEIIGLQDMGGFSLPEDIERAVLVAEL